MNTRSKILFCCLLLLVGCSKRERSRADDSEWADIQPLSERGAMMPFLEEKKTKTGAALTTSAPQENDSSLIERLAAMQDIDRSAGEVMITGESLIFDYERRFVRMDQAVKVIDDQGELEAGILMGRFSEENKVEVVEVNKGVKISSSGRKAEAESGTYTFADGAIVLEGNAWLTEGTTRLSGDRIKLWINENRRMICEPNASLEVSSLSTRKMGEGPAVEDRTEIRSDRLVYDESKALAEFDGNVRMRDSRAALNCSKVRLHLKENNEIDWIEALSEVIIQLDDRKALADRANFYADEGKFVLEGDPKVKQGLSIMTGDRISFWQESQRMVCEPKARVLFYPDEEMKAKFLKDLED